MHPANRKEPAFYRIVVNGRLEPDWSDYFGELFQRTISAKYLASCLFRRAGTRVRHLERMLNALYQRVNAHWS